MKEVARSIFGREKVAWLPDYCLIIHDPSLAMTPMRSPGLVLPKTRHVSRLRHNPRRLSFIPDKENGTKEGSQHQSKQSSTRASNPAPEQAIEQIQTPEQAIQHQSSTRGTGVGTRSVGLTDWMVVADGDCTTVCG